MFYFFNQRLHSLTSSSENGISNLLPLSIGAFSIMVLINFLYYCHSLLLFYTAVQQNVQMLFWCYKLVGRLSFKYKRWYNMICQMLKLFLLSLNNVICQNISLLKTDVVVCSLHMLSMLVNVYPVI